MKVLIVEDEPKLAGFVKKGLEEQAWEVDVAYDGQIGLSLALSTLYDVIVLDVNLPKINGFELAALLRREDVRTPILMLTANQFKFGGHIEGRKQPPNPIPQPLPL